MTDDAKTRFLAEHDHRHWSDRDPATGSARAALERLSLGWYEVAEETAEDSEYGTILRRLHDLLWASAEQSTHRADLAERRLAELRRSHLQLVRDVSDPHQATQGE